MQISTRVGVVHVIGRPLFTQFAVGSPETPETSTGRADNQNTPGHPLAQASILHCNTGNHAPRWSVKGEYLYVDLGRANHSFAFTGLPTLNHSAHVTLNVVRAGVNFRF